MTSTDEIPDIVTYAYQVRRLLDDLLPQIKYVVLQDYDNLNQLLINTRKITTEPKNAP